MLLLFDLRKPEGKSDEVIVEELEREASEMLGPWNREEYNSLVVLPVEPKHLWLGSCSQAGGDVVALP